MELVSSMVFSKKKRFIPEEEQEISKRVEEIRSKQRIAEVEREAQRRAGVRKVGNKIVPVKEEKHNLPRITPQFVEKVAPVPPSQMNVYDRNLIPHHYTQAVNRAAEEYNLNDHWKNVEPKFTNGFRSDGSHYWRAR
jgi:hypothetical protein